MYPFFRLTKTIIKALLSSKILFNEASEISFRCRPWDIDPFMELNNGRALTLFDMGRFDLIIRSVLGEKIRQKKWRFVVAGSTVRYRKRVRMFDKITLRTQLAGIEGRWIYVKQSMWVKGEPASSILLRTGVTSKGRLVAVEELARELDVKPEDYHPDEWSKSWIESEEKRPWPPA